MLWVVLIRSTLPRCFLSEALGIWENVDSEYEEGKTANREDFDWTASLC